MESVKANIFIKKKTREAQGSVIYAEVFKVKVENSLQKYLTVSHLCHFCSQEQKPLIVLSVCSKRQKLFAKLPPGN